MELEKGYMQLVAEAEGRVETISLDEALARLGDPDALFVDVRDVRELDREGMIPGALHVPRGLLEFWIDPASPYHKEVFAEDKGFVFYCSLGWRSAMATDRAREMGLRDICHIAGGFTAWKEVGNPVVERKRKSRPHG